MRMYRSSFTIYLTGRRFDDGIYTYAHTENIKKYPFSNLGDNSNRFVYNSVCNVLVLRGLYSVHVKKIIPSVFRMDTLSV